MATTLNSQLSRQHEVWREYAGVWHMNEDSGTAFDSTEHGLDALPSCGTNKLADISQMVAYENGACGRARVNATTANGNKMMIPSYDSLMLGPNFVASGWYYVSTVVGWAKLFFRNESSWEENGWGIEMAKNSSTMLSMVGATSSQGQYVGYVDIPDMKNGWVYCTFCYDANQVACYANGSLVKSGEVIAATDNGKPLYIGNAHSPGQAGYVGQYDEIRLRGGSLSADRIKADYDMIANRAFCTYGAVKKGAGE